MTREEHVKKAEKLLAGTWQNIYIDPFVGYRDTLVPPTADELALAQVHATLALTAPGETPEVPSETPDLPSKPRRWWSR